MIPAVDIRVHYKDGQTKDAVAWDDHGRPLVVGTRALVPADEVGPISYLEENANDHVVGVLPGQGWTFRYEGDSTPVVGWAIDRYGYGYPLDVETDGSVKKPDSMVGMSVHPPA